MNTDIKSIVKGVNAHFLSYREGTFYYQTDNGFKFTVPLEDIAGATLPASDKAIFFMKWIRRAIDKTA